MPNYINSKIYKLVCDDPDKIYIGSTTQKYLSNRLSGHHQDFKKKLKATMSRELFEIGGVKIVLIENFPCNTKDELLSRERYYIENFKCVNKHLPIHTKEELREHKREYQRTPIQKQKKKEYALKNKESKKEYDRRRYLEKREETLKRVKSYYMVNCEKIKEYSKAYYFKNK